MTNWAPGTILGRYTIPAGHEQAVTPDKLVATALSTVDLLGWDANGLLVVVEGGTVYVLPPDGNYGDITVSGTGTVWTINNGVVTFSKIAAGTIRERLSANRTYYVSTTGSDANNGLTPGTALLTVQRAIDLIAALDISIYNVTIQLSTGTYTGSCVVTGPWLGSGTVTIVGDTVTPANVIVQTTASSAGVIQSYSGGRIGVSGFELRASGGIGIGLRSGAFGRILVGPSMRFGACTNYHMNATSEGLIDNDGIFAPFSIVGSSGVHAQADARGTIRIAVSGAVTLTGTPAFSSSFVYSSRGSYVEYAFMSFSGAATGKRYTAESGSGIYVAGGGATFLPGSIAGTADATTYSWYA